MSNFQNIDSLHSVATKVDYVNPLLSGNVMGLSGETLGVYETFLGKFRTIMDNPNLQNGIIQDGHHRAHLSPVTSMIKLGNQVYFYRSIKGSGFSNPHGYLSKKDGNWTVTTDTPYTTPEVPEIVMKERTREYDWGYEVLGCFDDRVFSKLLRRAEDLNRSGARVEMIAKSGLLEEVVYNGEIVSVNEAKERGIIPNDEALKLRQLERLTRSRFRIKDFCELGGSEKIEAFRETLTLLNKENQETGNDFRYNVNDGEISTKIYLLETAKNLGKNLAIFLSKGYVMGYMNSGNITLSTGEVVDLDSLGELGEIYKPQNVNLGMDVKHYMDTKIPKETIKDVRDVTYAFNLLIKTMKFFTPISSYMRREIAQKFLESFMSHYSHSRRLDNFYDKDNLMKVIQFYVTQTLEKGVGQSMIQ